MTGKSRGSVPGWVLVVMGLTIALLVLAFTLLNEESPSWLVEQIRVEAIALLVILVAVLKRLRSK